MTRPLLVMATGWAHPPGALEPLAQFLRADAEVGLLPADTEAMPCIPATGDDRPLFLLGWSMGGMLLLDHTARHPTQVRGLILVSSTPKFCAAENFPHGIPEPNLRALTLAIRRAPEKALQTFFTDVAAPHSPPHLPERVAAALALEPARLMAGLRYLQQSDWRDAVKTLQIPTLIIHGRDDRIIPWQAGAWMDEQLPHSRLLVEEDVGHDLPLRRPERVAGMVGSFMREYL